MVAYRTACFFLMAVVVHESDRLSRRSAEGFVREICEHTPCEIEKFLNQTDPGPCHVDMSEVGTHGKVLNDSTLTFYRARYLGMTATLRGQGCGELNVRRMFTWRVDGNVAYTGKSARVFRVYSNGQREISVDIDSYRHRFFIDSKKPPYSALFVGGNIRAAYENSKFKVDARLSYDPDGLGVLGTVTFKWYCNVSNHDQMKYQDDPSHEPLPRSSQRIRRNSKRTEVTLSFPPFCCKPDEANCKPMNETGHTSSIELYANQFLNVPKLDYGVTVVISEAGRPDAYGLQVFAIIPTNIPIVFSQMHIVCVYNCFAEMDPSDHIVFEAVCEYGDGRQCNPSGPVWRIGYRDGSQTPDCKASPERSSFLVFRRNCFPYNVQIKINMFVNYDNHTDDNIHLLPSGQVMLRTKTTLSFPGCYLGPMSGFELSTEFNMRCLFMKTVSRKKSSMIVTRIYQTVINLRDGRQHDILLHFGGNLALDDAAFFFLVGSKQADNIVHVKIEVSENKMSPAVASLGIRVERLLTHGVCNDIFMFCMAQMTRKFISQAVDMHLIRRGLMIAQILVQVLNDSPTNNVIFIVERQMIRENITRLFEFMEHVYFEGFIEQIASTVRLLVMGDPLEITLTIRERCTQWLSKALRLYQLDGAMGYDQDSSAMSFEAVARKTMLAICQVYRLEHSQSWLAFAEDVVLNKLSGDIQSAQKYWEHLCRDEASRYRSYRDVVMQIGSLMESQDSTNLIGSEHVYVKSEFSGSSGVRDRTLSVYLKLLVLQAGTYPTECNSSLVSYVTGHLEATDLTEKRLITTELGSVIYMFKLVEYRPGSIYSREMPCHGFYVSRPDMRSEQLQDVYKLTFDSLDGDEVYAGAIRLMLKTTISNKTNKPFQFLLSNELPYTSYYDDLNKPDFSYNVTVGKAAVVGAWNSPSLYKKEMYFSIYLDFDTAEQFIRESGKEISTFYYNLDVMQYACLHWNETTNRWNKSEPTVTILAWYGPDPMGLYAYCTYTKGILSSHSVNVRPVQMTRVAPRYRPPPPRSGPNIPVLAQFVGIVLLLGLSFLLLAAFLDGYCGQQLSATLLRDVDPCLESRHPYLVSVSTGSKPGSTSAVSFRMHGDHGFGDVHLLKHVKRHALHRFSDEHFLVFTRLRLGNVDDVLLFLRRMVPHVEESHEEEEPTSWSLRDVRVYDVDDGEEWSCVVAEQLSTPSDKRLVMTAGAVDSKAFRPGLCERLGMRFQQYFLFAGCLCSFCCRRFAGELSTSVRTMLILLLLFVSFFVNVAIRGFPYTNDYVPDGSSNFEMPSQRNVKFAAITAAILLPIVVLLVFIVRRVFVWKTSWMIYIDIGESWSKDLEMLRREWQRMESLRLEYDRRRLRYCGGGGGRGTQRIAIVDTVVAGEPIDGRQWMNVNARQRLYFNIRMTRPPDVMDGDRIVDADAEAAELYDFYDGHRADEEGKAKRGWRWRSSCSWCRPAFNLNRGVLFSWLGLLIVWLPIVVFIVLFMVLGMRLNAADIRTWIVSSLLGLLICLLVFHPICIIAFAVVAPVRRQKENRSKIREKIPSALDERNRRILDLGSLEDYREYVFHLRRQPFYGHK